MRTTLDHHARLFAGAALAALTTVGCSNAESDKPVIGPPGADPSYYQRVVSAEELEAKKTATPPGAILGGEQVAPAAERVPPDLEAELEAKYQASIRLTDEQAAAQGSVRHVEVDFDALFERIRTTMPPNREQLLMEYLAAAKHEPSPRRENLLARLSSSELNNVR